MQLPNIIFVQIRADSVSLRCAGIFVATQTEYVRMSYFATRITSKSKLSFQIVDLTIQFDALIFYDIDPLWFNQHNQASSRTKFKTSTVQATRTFRCYRIPSLRSHDSVHVWAEQYIKGKMLKSRDFNHLKINNDQWKKKQSIK